LIVVEECESVKSRRGVSSRENKDLSMRGECGIEGEVGGNHGFPSLTFLGEPGEPSP
jgi:hypothetical protein